MLAKLLYLSTKSENPIEKQIHPVLDIIAPGICSVNFIFSSGRNLYIIEKNNAKIKKAKIYRNDDDMNMNFFTFGNIIIHIEKILSPKSKIEAVDIKTKINANVYNIAVIRNKK